MQRTSISIGVTHCPPGPGNFILRINLHHWEDGQHTGMNTILETRMYEVPELRHGDPLIWAEQITDEIYKTINHIRAERADTGWISGSGEPTPRA